MADAARLPEVMLASAAAAIPVAILVTLALWRCSDGRAEQTTWARLALRQPSSPGAFDASMIAALPDPARRYFRFAISPGTPLLTVAEINMEGEIGLGDKSAPNYLPMRARQILAAPHGFVWRLDTRNRLRVSGSDAAESGRSWSRFWLLGILPVARAGGNDDHARSAFGRCIAEAVFLTPAALLPGENVRWQALDESTARVTLAHRGLEQAVELCVDARGRPEKIVFERWSDANPEKVFRWQPFGGYLSNYRAFGGYRLPTRIEAGNMFDTDDYFPFFQATVTSVHFPG